MSATSIGLSPVYPSLLNHQSTNLLRGSGAILINLIDATSIRIPEPSLSIGLPDTCLLSRLMDPSVLNYQSTNLLRGSCPILVDLIDASIRLVQFHQVVHYHLVSLLCLISIFLCHIVVRFFLYMLDKALVQIVQVYP